MKWKVGDKISLASTNRLGEVLAVDLDRPDGRNYALRINYLGEDYLMSATESMIGPRPPTVVCEWWMNFYQNGIEYGDTRPFVSAVHFNLEKAENKHSARRTDLLHVCKMSDGSWKIESI